MDLLQNVDDKREVEFYINCYIITSYEKNLNNVLYLPLQKVSVFVKVSVIVTVFVMSWEDKDGVSIELWSSFSSNNSSNKSSI